MSALALALALVGCHGESSRVADLLMTAAPDDGALATPTDAASAADLAVPDLAVPDLASDDLVVLDAPAPDEAIAAEDLAVADLGAPIDLWTARDHVPAPILDAAYPRTLASAGWDVLFDPRALPQFYFDIPQSTWDVMATCAHTPGVVTPPECDYLPVTFHAVYDPDPSDNDPTTISTTPTTVGLRRKGNSTWRALAPPDTTSDALLFDRYGKPSFKVKLDEYGGKKLLGLTRLTLDNGVGDPSGLRLRLAYRVERALGIPAPLANSALVFVKAPGDTEFRSWGVYVNEQSVDKPFVKQRFGEVGGQIGNLYDTYNDFYGVDLDRCASRGQAGPAPDAQEGRYQLETNDNPGDKSDLTAVIDAVDSSLDGNWCHPPSFEAKTLVNDVNARVDVDGFLTAAAAAALLADWDGFFAGRHNYKLYHDLVTDRFVVIPLGADASFGWQATSYRANWAYPLDHSGSGRPGSLFFLRCLADTATCRPLYFSHVADGLAVWQTLPLADEVTTMAAQIRPYVDWHTDEFDRHLAFLSQFVATRGDCVQALLDHTTCAPLACPAAAQCTH